jgi:hypothetical protein
MADEPRDLVLEQLRLIREEQALTSRKIGAIAEGVVSIRKRLDDLDARMEAIRADMHMVTLAVDEHTIRLERIETRLNLHDAE